MYNRVGANNVHSPLGPARGLVALVSGALLALVTCGPARPVPDCAGLCATAERCGFLPSSLGGHPGDGDAELRADCTARCANTSTTAEIEDLRACFAAAVEPDLCHVGDCVEISECVLGQKIANQVLGRVDVTMRLLDGVFWSTRFQPATCEARARASVSGYGLDDLCAGHLELPACAVDDGIGVVGYCCADEPAQPSLCGPGDCEQDRMCDPRMCYQPHVSSAADCMYYGVESVQLAYEDPSGALQIDARVLTCEEASAGIVLADLPHGLLTPVALLRGTLSPQVALDLGRPEAAGRAFCWASTAFDAARLTRAGATTMVVPTPSADQLRDDLVERDARFPVGCGCVFATIGCESGPGCSNGIDDDKDGLVDAEDPGCGPADLRECDNGADDDDDGLIDAADPDCR